MTEITRRGFLGMIAAAIAGAAAGITPASGHTAAGITPASGHTATAPGEGASELEYVNARHIWWADISNDYFCHRIDIAHGAEQYGVDCISRSRKLDPVSELGPALAQLDHFLESKGLAVGEIFTYSAEEWASDLEAQARWGRIGDRVRSISGPA